MEKKRQTLKPIQRNRWGIRRRLGLKEELLLALLPTAIVLGALLLVEVLADQRLLFTSLASSAFLIYLDPHHRVNNVRTLVIAQMMAAVLGLLLFLILGPGYAAGGAAMVGTIVGMVLLDAVHPPAVGTSLIFAFRSGEAVSNLVLFMLAVGITASLVFIERFTLWFMARSGRTSE